MLRAVYMLGSLVTIAAAVLVLLPFILFEVASRLWRRVELHAIYNGDAQAQIKEEWRG